MDKLLVIRRVNVSRHHSHRWRQRPRVSSAVQCVRSNNTHAHPSSSLMCRQQHLQPSQLLNPMPGIWNGQSDRNPSCPWISTNNASESWLVQHATTLETVGGPSDDWCVSVSIRKQLITKVQNLPKHMKQNTADYLTSFICYAILVFSHISYAYKLSAAIYLMTFKMQHKIVTVGLKQLRWL